MTLVVWDTLDSSMGVQAKDLSRVTHPSTKVFELECRPTDTGVSGASSTAMRCELSVSKDVAGMGQGDEAWIGFGIEGVSGPTPEGAFGMRAQLHGPNGTGQPQMVVNTPGGLLNVRLWDAGNNVQTNWPVVDSGGVQITWANGVIYWFVARIINSTDRAVGLIEMWCNGVKFCSHSLQTLYTTAKRGTPPATVTLDPAEYFNYPKFGGAYTNDLSDTLVSRSHNRCRGASMAEVVSNFPAGTGFTAAPPPAAPSVGFLSPAADATVSGRVDWYAEAANPGGSVHHVQFLVDGVQVLSEVNPPYGDTVTHWDTTAHADGAHTLTLRAYSDATTVVATATRAVTIANTAPPPAPPPIPEDIENSYYKVLGGAGAKVAGGKRDRAKIAGGKR